MEDPVVVAITSQLTDDNGVIILKKKLAAGATKRATS